MAARFLFLLRDLRCTYGSAYVCKQLGIPRNAWYRLIRRKHTPLKKRLKAWSDKLGFDWLFVEHGQLLNPVFNEFFFRWWQQCLKTPSCFDFSIFTQLVLGAFHIFHQTCPLLILKLSASPKPIALMSARMGANRYDIQLAMTNNRITISSVMTLRHTPPRNFTSIDSCSWDAVMLVQDELLRHYNAHLRTPSLYQQSRVVRSASTHIRKQYVATPRSSK